MGWGLIPHDPVASINAAAKHMATYVRQYGGSEKKALAAYNAGSGAVAKYGGVPPYAETQNYIKTILGSAGKGKTTPTPMGKPGTKGTRGTPGSPGTDNSSARLALAQSYLANRDKPNAALTFAAGIRSTQDTPGTAATPGTPATPATPGGDADPRDIVGLGKIAQKMGLHVGENPAFGGVSQGAHVPDSYHYKNEAIDVSGDPDKMLAFNKLLASRYGGKLKELFYNNPGGQNIKDGKPEPIGFVSGHKDHVHVAM
jgi:hypothetical protein